MPDKFVEIEQNLITYLYERFYQIQTKETHIILFAINKTDMIS